MQCGDPDLSGQAARWRVSRREPATDRTVHTEAQRQEGASEEDEVSSEEGQEVVPVG